MRSVYFPLLASALISAPLTAQYTQFGGGCNGGTTTTCVSQNAAAAHVPYATGTGGLINEYAHAVINSSANTVTIIGFRVKTDTVAGTPVTRGTALYRDAAGAGSLVHSSPDLTPEAMGNITVDGPAAFYDTYCYPAMIVAPGECFWVSVDTNGINPPDARLGSTTAPAPSFWRRPPFGTTAFAQTGIVQDPILEVMCHGDTSIPVLGVDAPPATGTTINITISGADASSAAGFLSWGLSNTTWNTLPLPLDLGLFGINGCNMLMSADVATFVLLTNGVGTSPFAIPNDPLLAGTTLYNQAAEIRAGAPAGVVLTNGGELIVQ